MRRNVLKTRFTQGINESNNFYIRFIGVSTLKMSHKKVGQTFYYIYGTFRLEMQKVGSFPLGLLESKYFIHLQNGYLYLQCLFD